jgi:predicted esterase
VCVVLTAILLWGGASGAAWYQSQELEAQYPTCEKMREKLGSLFQEEKFAEAAALLEWAFGKFPDKAYANAYNLGLVYARLGDLQKGVNALQRALDRGLFFGKWDFEGAAWAPYAGFAPFQKIKDACEAARAELEKKAILTLEIAEPESYDASQAYPLFVALHGGGENLAEFRPRWQSPVLRKEFLVAYVQSTQVATMTGFHWQDESRTKAEIAEAYRRAASRYKIKPGEVIIGGFSSGGFGSLICLFRETIPAAGFVILCPPVPETLRDEEILGAKGRGVRGTILTTERDTRLPAQRALAERFVSQGLDVRLVVQKDLGHWYPDNLPALIDAAIGHIRTGR